MVRLRNMFVISLAAVFFALSFNAYACLVPVFGTSHAMAKGCADTEDTGSRVFCDSFKMLGAHSPEKAAPTDIAQSLHVSHDLIKPTLNARSSLDMLLDGSPPTSLPRFAVLRI